MFGPLVHRLLQVATPVSRPGMRVSTARLCASLPALGSVLYIPMRRGGLAAWEMPRGVLAEAMSLAPLLQACQLVAGSMITVEGPREWIECVDRQGGTCARLHLLPDTDYLAWDGLLACGETALVSKPGRAPRHSHPASAQVLRFHVRRMAGLTVLGAEVATRVSLLSRQLAARIACAEAVPLQLASGD